DSGDCFPHASGGAPQFRLLAPGFELGIPAEADLEAAIRPAIGMQLQDHKLGAVQPHGRADLIEDKFPIARMCGRRQCLGTPGNPDRILVNNPDTLQEFREALLKSIIETPDDRRIADILLTRRIEMKYLLHSCLLRPRRGAYYRSSAPSRISSVA